MPSKAYSNWSKINKGKYTTEQKKLEWKKIKSNPDLLKKYENLKIVSNKLPKCPTAYDIFKNEKKRKRLFGMDYAENPYESRF